MTRTLIFSPHLDDAVLSCFHLAGEACQVVNVFDALPPVDAPLTQWDQLTGFASARDCMIERVAEDKLALAHTIWSSQGLGLYRPEATHQGLRAAVEALVGPHDTIYAPAGIGGHPGHVLVRDVLLDIDVNLHLYADIPYAISGDLNDLPSEGSPELPAAWTEDLAAAVRLAGELGPLSVHRLSATQTGAKLDACALYASQMALLDQEHGGAISDPTRMGIEFSWHVS